MPEKLINQRDLEFQLYEVLDTESLINWPRFGEHSREIFDATLDTARKIAEKFFAPHNREGDENDQAAVDDRAGRMPIAVAEGERPRTRVEVTGTAARLAVDERVAEAAEAPRQAVLPDGLRLVLLRIAVAFLAGLGKHGYLSYSGSSR